MQRKRGKFFIFVSLECLKQLFSGLRHKTGPDVLFNYFHVFVEISISMLVYISYHLRQRM